MIELRPDQQSSAIQDTLELLQSLDRRFTYQIAPDGKPAGEGWFHLSELLDPEMLSTWLQELTDRYQDKPAAVSFLAGWIIGTVVCAWVLPVLARSRLPLVTAEQVFLHRHEGGWFDAVAMEDRELAVLPEDSAASFPGAVVVPDQEVLLEKLLERLLWLDSLCCAYQAACRFSGTTFWGFLADQIGFRALWLARTLDSDRMKAWQDAETIIDVLMSKQPQMRTRPKLFSVTYAGREEFFPVRGTCCLKYRTKENPDRDGEGYCPGCPLRTESSRTRKFLAHLQKVGRQK